MSPQLAAAYLRLIRSRAQNARLILSARRPRSPRR